MSFRSLDSLTNRPTRPPNGISHGAAGGAAFNAGGRALEKDADRPVSNGKGREVGYLDDEDEEGEEEDEAELEAARDAKRREKKRRVVADSEDEESD
jgi:hypothetical protein